MNAWRTAAVLLLTATSLRAVRTARRRAFTAGVLAGNSASSGAVVGGCGQ